MDSVSTTLEGSKRFINPSKEVIERELSLLEKDKVEFVILNKGGHFIQAASHSEKYFKIEIGVGSGPYDTDEVYEYKYPASFGEAVGLFQDFLSGIDVKSNSSWRKIDRALWAVTSQAKRIKPFSKATVVPLAFISLLVVGGASMAAFSSKQPWYHGALAGLAAVLFISASVVLAPIIFERYVPTLLENLSKKIGMPRRVNLSLRRYERYNLKTEDQKKNEFPKKTFLETALVVATLFGAAVLLVGLSVVIYMWHAGGK